MILEIVAIVVCYLLGSVSFSVLLAKILKGIDIRQHGSGNAGATNTLRVLGKGPAILVLALDVIKGIAAVWIGRWLGETMRGCRDYAALPPSSVIIGLFTSAFEAAKELQPPLGCLLRSASFQRL